MTLLSHLGHPVPHSPVGVLRRPRRTAGPWLFRAAGPQGTAERPDIDPRIFAVHRLGAVGVGLVSLAVGILGATGGVGFLPTHGGRSPGGLLPALPLVVAAVLLGAAVHGPRLASTVMIVLGALFLVWALVDLALLRTTADLLASQVTGVVLSVVGGLTLLVLGAHGRISGNLPASSPYAHPHAVVDEPSDLPSTPEEVAAEAAMREAEVAVVQHRATEDQQRRVRAMSGVRTRDGRRRIWLELDETADPAPRGGLGSVVGR